MVPSPHIVVVGSVNMDLVARVARLPRPGETVAGHNFLTVPGGKGANQAVAAARLGAQTTMIGRVGDDDFGIQLTTSLQNYGVDTTHVLTTPACPSGVALIGVSESGENAIIVVPGANGRLTPNDVRRLESVMTAADAVVLQLEVPVSTVAAALAIARQHGVLTVLDPAPVPDQPMSGDLYQVNLFTPNQTEAEALSGIAVTDEESAAQAARVFLNRGATSVVIKMGELGAVLVGVDGQAHHVTARRVNVVDTTAAGDAFTAALAVATCEGRAPLEAVEFACNAGTLATTRLGAQTAMPTRAELEALTGVTR